MPFEYILFNLLVLLGPLISSFEEKVHYVQDWGRVLAAAGIVAIPFLTWDMLVTGRHWWFNDSTTLPIRILHLPIGEILFFFTVPFAALFVWRILGLRFQSRSSDHASQFRWILAIAFIAAGILAQLRGWEYTGIVSIIAAAVLILDVLLRTNLVFSTRYLIFLFLLTLMILIFNGYLTARPMVLYSTTFKSGWMIYTIPLEDFLYGYSHITLVTILFEWLNRRRHV